MSRDEFGGFPKAGVSVGTTPTAARKDPRLQSRKQRITLPPSAPTARFGSASETLLGVILKLFFLARIAARLAFAIS
jgi:hypothetical protein